MHAWATTTKYTTPCLILIYKLIESVKRVYLLQARHRVSSQRHSCSSRATHYLGSAWGSTVPWVSPCPTSRTGTLGVPGNYVHKLPGMAEGWKSPPARCCRSRRCCPRRKSRTEEFQKFRWGRSPPHLLGGGGAILIWTEIDAEGGEKCGQSEEGRREECLRPSLHFPLWSLHSKVALQSFQDGLAIVLKVGWKTFDLLQATCSLSGRVCRIKWEENNYNQWVMLIKSRWEKVKNR